MILITYMAIQILEKFISNKKLILSTAVWMINDFIVLNPDMQLNIALIPTLICLEFFRFI